MTSPLLALFIQSLAQDVYGKVAYWTRASLCGFILFILLVVVQVNSWSGANGLIFFIGIVSFQMLAITLIGLSYFGSAITEEKEEQTLGLLRMTDLSPLSILLGKSTSRLCGALLLLAAVFPFTIFAVTLGGTSLGQIIASYCTIAAYMFLLCNVALLGSVLARHTGGAARFTTAVIGLFLAAGPLLQGLHAHWGKLGAALHLDTIGAALWQCTPIARLNAILATGFSGSAAGWQVASNLGLGVVFFLLAWAAFDRFCDRAPGEVGAANVQLRRTVGIRVGRPPRPVGRPIGWKDFYFLYGGTHTLAFRVFGYLVFPVGLLGGLLLATSARFDEYARMLNTYLPMIFFLDTGAMAARMYRSELNDQTLSALATLPGTIRRIAYRKARLLLCLAVPGMISVLGITTLHLWFNPPYGGSVTFHPRLLVVQITEVVMQTVAFVHIVTWLSLVMKRGALPLGIVITLTLALIASMSEIFFSFRLNLFRWVGISNVNISLVVTVFLCTTVSIALHFRSLRRLEVLAGEG